MIGFAFSAARCGGEHLAAIEEPVPKQSPEATATDGGAVELGR